MKENSDSRRIPLVIGDENKAAVAAGASRQTLVSITYNMGGRLIVEALSLAYKTGLETCLIHNIQDTLTNQDIVLGNVQFCSIGRAQTADRRAIHALKDPIVMSQGSVVQMIATVRTVAIAGAGEVSLALIGYRIG